MNDREIMERLGLTRTRYFVYRARLYKDHGIQFEKTAPDELAYHKDLLQERLTRIFRQLELDLTRTGTSTRDKAMIGLAMQNIAANIFKLNFEGLRVRQNGWLKYGATDGYLQGNSTGRDGNNIHVLPSAYAQQQEGGTAGTTADRGTLHVPRPPDEEPDESEIY